MNRYGPGPRAWLGWLTLVGVTLAGCATTPPTAPREAPGCDALTVEIERVANGVDVLLQDTIKASPRNKALVRVRDSFMTLRARAPLSGSVCADFTAGHINRTAYLTSTACLSERIEALEAMQRDFADASLRGLDVRQLAWRLDAKIDWIRQTATCEARAAAGNPRGGERVQPDAITLGTPLKVSAALMCARLGEEGDEAVKRCNGATLRDGDRFKVFVETSAPAHLYFYLFNGSGQFQMFFPDVGISNRTEAEGRYSLPDASWMRLDEVHDVFERIVVVASREPIEELEELRGVDLPPTESGDFALQARDVRGIIEPLITRGAGIEQTTPVHLDGVARPAFPVIVEDEQTVAIEYEIYHAPR